MTPPDPEWYPLTVSDVPNDLEVFFKGEVTDSKPVPSLFIWTVYVNPSEGFVNLIIRLFKLLLLIPVPVCETLAICSIPGEVPSR